MLASVASTPRRSARYVVRLWHFANPRKQLLRLASISRKSY
jgi:hypothetical protein